MLYQSMFWYYIKQLEKENYRVVRRNLEETLEVKTFFKMLIGLNCRDPKVEL